MFKPFFIHINPFKPGHTYHNTRSWGVTFYVIQDPEYEKHVLIGYALCNKKDQYNKKIGRAVAQAAERVSVRKHALPKYVAGIVDNAMNVGYTENSFYYLLKRFL
jgi:hypothetical protein